MNKLSRRGFLKASWTSLAAALLPVVAIAQTPSSKRSSNIKRKWMTTNDLRCLRRSDLVVIDDPYAPSEMSSAEFERMYGQFPSNINCRCISTPVLTKDVKFVGEVSLVSVSISGDRINTGTIESKNW